MFCQEPQVTRVRPESLCSRRMGARPDEKDGGLVLGAAEAVSGRRVRIG